MRIGLISDTHLPSRVKHLGELGPQVGEFLAGVKLILHGGDVVLGSVFDWCEQFAPVLAATGNNDHFTDPRMQPLQFLDIEGWRIGMAHDLEPETRPLQEIEQRVFGREIDIIIGGHTHYEHIRHDGRHLLVNSGSPVFPHQYETRLGTAALLDIRPDMMHAEIVLLGETPGMRNPGRASALTLTRDALRQG
jgi:uncharacterized protein